MPKSQRMGHGVTFRKKMAAQYGRKKITTNYDSEDYNPKFTVCMNCFRVSLKSLIETTYFLNDNIKNRFLEIDFSKFETLTLKYLKIQ